MVQMLMREAIKNKGNDERHELLELVLLRNGSSLVMDSAFS